jgi:TPR repeat protein
MTHFVRCIDGHVFDAEVALQCPVCGAIVDAPPQVAAIASAAVTPGVSDSDATQTKPPAPPARRELPAQLRRSALRIVIGGVILAPILAVFKLFVLPSIYPPAVQPPSAQSPPQISVGAPATPAPTNAEASKQMPAAAPVAPVDISDTIKSALNVARMAVLYDRHEYSQVADIARNLAARDNVAGPFMLGTLQLGPLGTQNIPEARKQFTAAAKLGDSDAAMLAARMLEQGAGGPRDVDGAKALYLFAARNGDTNADRELARLNVSDQRGMTVIEADNNLFAGKDIDESWKRMNELIAAPSITAVCMAGWLYGNGNSVQRDFNRALALFKTGAATGNPSCLWGLSRLVARGLANLSTDYVAADVLLQLAAQGAGPKATGFGTEIAALESKMTDADKTRAKQMLQPVLPSAPAAQSSAPGVHP